MRELVLKRALSGRESRIHTTFACKSKQQKAGMECTENAQGGAPPGMAISLPDLAFGAVAPENQATESAWNKVEAAGKAIKEADKITKAMEEDGVIEASDKPFLHAKPRREHDV